MKLISITDFVLKIENEIKKEDYQIVAWQLKVTAIDRIFDYAKFLKQPLTLGMFIPCDEESNILEEPLAYNFKSVELFTNYKIKYQKAKEKVIFNGFHLDETYKREKSQLPYLTNGKISVFLHSNFAIRHQLIEDLVDSDLDCTVSF